MDLTKRKVIAALAITPVVIAVGHSASVVLIDSYQKRRNARIVAENYTETYGDEALVVYFSRSGNTEIMARELARAKNARTARLSAERYDTGLVGWVNTLRDARQTDAKIEPSSYDVAGYKEIYLGSPIWMYSPAPPIWEFVRSNDFTGSKVFLFNSMNSKFEQRYIDEFADLVRERGGVFGGHIFIIRGRMTRQMDVETFVSQTRAQIAKI